MLNKLATAEGCVVIKQAVQTLHLKAPPPDLEKVPVILLLVGALSPITHMHLRLLGK